MSICFYDNKYCQIAIPANFFSVKRMRFYLSTEPEFQKITDSVRRSSKISNDFQGLPKIPRRLLKIIDYVGRFLTTSKQDSHELFLTKKIEVLFNWFFSNYTYYCQLGVRNWSECVRLQF